MEYVIYGIALLAAAIVGYIIRLVVSKKNLGSVEKQAAQIIEEARKDAKQIIREGKIEVKDELHRVRAEFEESTKERREKLDKEEEYLDQKKQNLDRRADLLEEKEETIAKEREKINAIRERADRERERAERMVKEEEEALERIAGFSREEACARLMEKLEHEVEYDASNLVRKAVQEAEEEADKKAKEIITQAIQRCASEHVADTTVCSVSLPSDDIKGRIIGREGRNIRTLESATGVEVLIDDTPNAVVISGFDPVRREVARRTLERLIADGRIHPTRIEEVLEKVRSELGKEVEETGQQAALELGLSGIKPALIKLIGQLKFRTSYGQNLLNHSLEVAKIMAALSGELGLDIMKAKRIGLLHDIGKAVDHEIEGPHATIGAELARRHNEPEDIVNAIAAHHNEVEAKSILAVLASAADAISAARPGARSEAMDMYIKRIEQLESIAGCGDGVKGAYAIQAGREVRVIVDAESIDDNESIVVARNIAKRVSDEMKFPGQIKVTVVRETRAVEYAR